MSLTTALSTDWIPCRWYLDETRENTVIIVSSWYNERIDQLKRCRSWQWPTDWFYAMKLVETDVIIHGHRFNKECTEDPQDGWRDALSFFNVKSDLSIRRTRRGDAQQRDSDFVVFIIRRLDAIHLWIESMHSAFCFVRPRRLMENKMLTSDCRRRMNV